MADIIVTYLVETTRPADALRAIERGQSVGNPTILTPYETRNFLAKWQAGGSYDLREARDPLHTMVVRFPQGNFGKEGLAYLLSVILGGQCDIDSIEGCRIMEVDVGMQMRHWGIPRFGISGLRQRLQVWDRPFVCGIIKPKIGLTPSQLADIVQQMAEGGCDIIKEDEILADQWWCPMRVRLPLVAKALDGYPSLYLACVTGDGSEAWKKARLVEHQGANFGVHCNLWAGVGTLLDLWRHVKCPLFFQKSGDKVWTIGKYSLDASVLCQLVHYAGCDIAHVGMYGGYLAEPVSILMRRIEKLKTTLPSFSCGMTPRLAGAIRQQFGCDVMVTSGGWIHGQPDGIPWAVRQLRQAITSAPVEVVSDGGRLVDRSV